MWPIKEQHVAMAVYAKVRDNEAEFDRAARTQANATLAARGGEVEPFGRFTTGNEEMEKAAFNLHHFRTARADEMKMPRVTVSRLEAGASFAEVDFPGNAGADHPLQRAIHRGTGDTRRLAADALEEIVRADVSLLAEEYVQDAIAFAGALTADRAEAGEIWKLAIHLANW
jgi:hypothetical protein